MSSNVKQHRSRRSRIWIKMNSKVHAFSKKGTLLHHLLPLTLLSFPPLVIDENGILVCRPRFCRAAQPPCTHAVSYILRISSVPSASSQGSRVTAQDSPLQTSRLKKASKTFSDRATKKIKQGHETVTVCVRAHPNLNEQRPRRAETWKTRWH